MLCALLNLAKASSRDFYSKLRSFKFWAILAVILSCSFAVYGNSYYACSTLSQHQYCGLAKNIAYHLPKTLKASQPKLAKASEDMLKTWPQPYTDWK